MTAYALEPGDLVIASRFFFLAAALIGIGLLTAALVHLARR